MVEPTRSLTAEQRRLVTDSVPLAKWYSRRYAFSLGRDEAFAVCCSAITTAAITFDPLLGKWSPYAVRAMKLACINAFRDKRRTVQLLIDVPESPDDKFIFPEHVLEWLKTRGVEEASDDALEAAILMGYFEGATQKVIARQTGFSEAYVTRKKKALFKRLRKLAEKEKIL